MDILNITNPEIEEARKAERNTPKPWFWDTIKTWGKEAVDWVSQLYKGAVNSIKNSFTDTTPLYNYNSAKQLLNDYDTIKNIPVASLNQNQLGQLVDNYANIKQNLSQMWSIEGIRQRVENDNQFYLNTPEPKPLSVQEAKAKYLKELSLNSVLSQTEQRNRTFRGDWGKSYTYDKAHSNEVAANIFEQFSSKTDPILNTIAELEDVYEKNGNKWDTPEQQNIYNEAMKQWVSSVEYIKHVVNHEDELQDLGSSVQNFIKRSNWKYTSPFTVEDITGWSNNEDYYSQALATETFKKGWNQVFWDWPKAKGLLDMFWGGFGSIFWGINKHAQNLQTRAVVGYRDLTSLALWTPLDQAAQEHENDIMMGDSNRLRDVNNTLAHDSSFRRSSAYYITDTATDWYDALRTLPKILSAPMSIFKSASKIVDESRDIYKAIDLTSDALKAVEKTTDTVSNWIKGLTKVKPLSQAAKLSEEVASNLSKIAPELSAPSKLAYWTRKIFTTIAKEIAENFVTNAALNGTSRQDYKPTDLAIDIFTGLLFPGIWTMLDIKGYSPLLHLQQNAEKYAQAAFNLDDLTWHHIDPSLRNDLTNTMLVSVEKNWGKMQQSIDALKKVSRPFEELQKKVKNVARKSTQRFFELADKEKRGHLLEQKPDKTWTLKKDPNTWKAIATFKDYINLQRDVVESQSTASSVKLSKNLEEIANNIVNFEKLDDKMKANTIRGTIESAWENMMYFFQKRRDKYHIKPAETYDQFYEQLQKRKYHRIMEGYAYEAILSYNMSHGKTFENMTFEQLSTKHDYVYYNWEAFFNKIKDDPNLSPKEKADIVAGWKAVTNRRGIRVIPQPPGRAYWSAYEMAYFLGTSGEVEVDWITYTYQTKWIQGWILTFEWVAEWHSPIHFWVDRQYVFHALDVDADSYMDFIKTDGLMATESWEIASDSIFGTFVKWELQNLKNSTDASSKSTPFGEGIIKPEELTTKKVYEGMFDSGDALDIANKSWLPINHVETLLLLPWSNKLKEYIAQVLVNESKLTQEQKSIMIVTQPNPRFLNINLETLLDNPEHYLEQLDQFYYYKDEARQLIQKAIDAKVSWSEKIAAEVRRMYTEYNLGDKTNYTLSLNPRSPLLQEYFKALNNEFTLLFENSFHPEDPFQLALEPEWTYKIVGKDKELLHDKIKKNRSWLFMINPNRKHWMGLDKLPEEFYNALDKYWNDVDVYGIHQLADDITKYWEYSLPQNSKIKKILFDNWYWDYIGKPALEPLINADNISESRNKIFNKLLDGMLTANNIIPETLPKDIQIKKRFRYHTWINFEPFQLSEELLNIMDNYPMVDFFKAIKWREELIPKEYIDFVEKWSTNKKTRNVYDNFKKNFDMEAYKRKASEPKPKEETPKPTKETPKSEETSIPKEEASMSKEEEAPKTETESPKQETPKKEESPTAEEILESDDSITPKEEETIDPEIVEKITPILKKREIYINGDQLEFRWEVDAENMPTWVEYAINKSDTLLDLMSNTIEDLALATKWDEAAEARLNEQWVFLKKSIVNPWLFQGIMYNLGKDRDAIFKELYESLDDDWLFWVYNWQESIDNVKKTIEESVPKVEEVSTPKIEEKVSNINDATLWINPVKLTPWESLYHSFKSGAKKPDGTEIIPQSSDIHRYTLRKLLWDNYYHKGNFTKGDNYNFKYELDLKKESHIKIYDFIKKIKNNDNLTPWEAYKILSDEIKAFFENFKPIDAGKGTWKTDRKRYTFVNSDLQWEALKALQWEYNLIFEWPAGLEKFYNITPVEVSPLAKAVFGLNQTIYKFEYNKPTEINIDWVKQTLDFEEYVNKIINADTDNFITSCPV